MTFATAQDAFSAFMKDYIGPALRRLGFRGTAGKYTLPEPEHWVALGFQRSFYSDRDEARFTINVTATSRLAWSKARERAPYFPEQPLPNTFYGTDVWQQRIGSLMPGGNDQWWHITKETDLAMLAAEVIRAIEQSALPAIRAQVVGSASRE